jgi:hypothetical protein
VFKKFLNGVVFGAGFALSFIVIVIIYFQFFFIDSINSRTPYKENEEIMTEVSTVSKPRLGFLGSSAVFSGNFPSDKSKTLSKGVGKIIGTIYAEGEPVKGIELRLGLNGEVMSQWATTDNTGIYEVNVPAGEYQINGYEIDLQTANKYLFGLIDEPRNNHSSDIFKVSDGKDGVGLSLSFVKPVIKLNTQNELNIDQDVIISWETYPEAAHYMIQVYRKEAPTDYITNDTLFQWSNREKTTSTSLKLNGLSEKLEPGFYYVSEVHAIDENGKHISGSGRQHSSFDFYIKKPEEKIQ